MKKEQKKVVAEQEQVKTEIKQLYKKDKELAKEVAKVLGYKIVAKAVPKSALGPKGPKGAPLPPQPKEPKKVAVPNKVDTPKVKKGSRRGQ